MPRKPISQSAARGLAIALFVIGCAAAVWRGPARALDGGNGDGALVYASARAWLSGANPYESGPVSEAWKSGGGAADRDPMIVRTREVLLYPPTALAAMAPVAALPWSIASVVWVLLNTALMGAAIVGAAALAGLARGSVRWWWVMAGGVWLAPFHTSLAHGQTAVVVVACIVLGQVARMRGRSAGAGVLMGLGAAIKPQLAGLFLVYEAGRGRWKSVAWGAAAIAVLTVVGAGRMEMKGGEWRESWVRNVREFAAVGDGRPTADNPIRHQLVNLHYPMHEMVEGREAVVWMVYAVVGGLCAAYAWVDWRARRQGRREDTRELVSLSMVAAATLLVVYHRFYDAAVLVIPVALAVGSAGVRRWVPIACLLPFFANSAVVLAELARRGTIPEAVTGSGFWRAAVMPHQVWALVALAVWLTWRRQNPEVVQPSRE